MYTIQVKNKGDIITLIGEFKLYIYPLIEKTFNRDKCVARDRLCAIDDVLSVLDIYLEDPTILLCIESIKKLKTAVTNLKPIKLVTADEKQRISAYAFDIIKDINLYLIQKCDEINGEKIKIDKKIIYEEAKASQSKN